MAAGGLWSLNRAAMVKVSAIGSPRMYLRDFIILAGGEMMDILSALTVVYDPSVWTEAGYTIQRYIGSATIIGIRIFAILFGLGLIAKIIHWLAKP